ncbi:MAG: acetolactate synthase small subunit [Acutalibacteraceae bacterium]|nr:acetolactate synthase small subunit [Acutalibacteraceae bacterium]
MSKYVIAVYVDNKPGVLTRVSSMFTRRAFNIDTLTVGEIENPAYSRITISLSGDEYTKNQIVAQLHKLHNVQKVKVLEDESTMKRELMIIKMKNNPHNRAEIMAAAEVYKGKIIDYSVSTISVEVTGEPVKIDAFIELMKPLGILEMCRTGIVAIERGAETMFSQE